MYKPMRVHLYIDSYFLGSSDSMGETPKVSRKFSVLTKMSGKESGSSASYISLWNSFQTLM